MFHRRTIFYVFFAHTINGILAECWIRYKNVEHPLPLYPHLSDPKRFFCGVGLEVCCEDACCNSSSQYTLYPYIWEIIITAMLIFMSLLVCVCGFYYCKYSFQKTALLRNVESQMVDRREITSQPVAPPPHYDVAILLPPVNPSDRIPSYEEAVSKERF